MNTVNLIIKKGKNTSNKESIVTSFKQLFFYGFETKITNLKLCMFCDGQFERYDIIDPALGFSIEGFESCSSIWFEYSETDKDYTVVIFFD